MAILGGAQSSASKGSGDLDIAALFSVLNEVSSTSQSTSDIREGIRVALREVCNYTGWPIGHAYLRHEKQHVVEEDAGGAVAGEIDPIELIMSGGAAPAASAETEATADDIPEDEEPEVTAKSSQLWHLDASINKNDVQDFVNMSENTVFVPGQGMVGKVLASKEPVTIPDVTVLPGFVRAEGAKRNNVQGCFAFPVVYKNNAEVILEFFSREVAVLDKTTLEILRFVGNQLVAILTVAEHNEHIQTLAAAFQSGVANAVSQTEMSIFTLNESAKQLSESIADAKVNAAGGVEYSNKTTEVVASVTGGVTDVTNAIRTISEDVNNANDLAKTCQQKMATADEKSSILNDAADRVTTVIGSITDFANKTNMLALNATIEAARAGEAGKGFAVVAGEVKDLAAQTGKSAQEIEEVVGEMITAISEITQSLEDAGATVSDIASRSAVISESINGQYQTTEGISGEMSVAERSSADVTERLSDMTTAFDESSQAADYVAMEADTISQQSNILKTSVDDFLNKLLDSQH